MKQSIILRLSAILWVWLICMCGSLPTMAQFDEPSRNQWFVDFSYGFGDPIAPDFNYHDKSTDDKLTDNGEAHNVTKIGLSFGINRRLFHNFYAGVRIGYKYSEYEVTNIEILSKTGKYSKREYLNAKLNYHVLNLPIEIGYNHTLTHRSGLNIYASAQPGYCVAYNMSDRSDYKAKKNISFSNPGLCLDCSAGLRYFIRHVSIGLAYHHPLNDAQKTVGSETIEFSLGYRF